MREPVGTPVNAEEIEGDGVDAWDELNMGDTTGPEWDVGSMLVMQRGLVTASWVAGRRRVTREGTEREGRKCRRKGNGGIEVELETAVMDVDTSEDSSLRSLIGDEAGVIGSHGEGDLAPQAPKHARGEGAQGNKRLASSVRRDFCGLTEPMKDMASVKRKRQFEEGTNGQKMAVDVRAKEKRQPQLSIYSREYGDKCGSKRRRVQDKKGDCIEDTNSMKKRLEGDDWIE